MKRAIRVASQGLCILMLIFTCACGGGGGGGGSGARGCIDADGDGYQTNCALGSDCDDSNPFTHPGAYELGCDLVDNNCSGSIDEVEVVAIADPNLEAALRDALDIPAGDILNADFCGVNSLNLSDKSILSLNGLEYGFYFEHLDLQVNYIVDITPLAGLKNLNYLALFFNLISDISPLAGLSEMETLGLSDNDISDISPLSQLTAMQYLELIYNPVNDLSPLSELSQLRGLALWQNSISDISILSSLTNLQILELGEMPISNLSALSVLTNLEVLWLQGCSFSDLQPLVDNPGLGSGDEIFLLSNPLDSEACSSEIPALEARGALVHYDNCPPKVECIDNDDDGWLINCPITPDSLDCNDDNPFVHPYAKEICDGIDNNCDTNIDELEVVGFMDPNLHDAIISEMGLTGNTVYNADFCGVTYLNLQNRNIQFLLGLQYGSSLEELDLSNNTINSYNELSTLGSLHNLKVLRISSNQIVDLTGIQVLTSLEVLNLENNRIVELEPLRELPQLVTLQLAGNHISNLTDLRYLTNLAELDLDRNLVSDIYPLAGMANLVVLKLEHNQINNLFPLTFLRNLGVLELKHNRIADVRDLVDNPGLAAGDSVFLEFNRLDFEACSSQVPALRERGASVTDSCGCIDNDGDWYGVICPLGPDCDDTHAFVHPGAPEIACGEGLDNDCDLAVDESETVTFVDPNLETVVRSMLGKPAGDILNTDYCGFTQLTASSLFISDLTGLEYAYDLEELYLDVNQISDISALAGLVNLGALGLSGNFFADISPLSELNKLVHLGLAANAISDISPLSGLTALQYLSLSDNQLRSISGLSWLDNLIGLWLDFNQISDISVISNLTSLSYVDLSYNRITSVSSLAGLPWALTDDNLDLNSNMLDTGDCADLGVLSAKVEYLFFSQQYGPITLTCP